MTTDELIQRATNYVRQALARLDSVEPQLALPPDVLGDWVSLRRNLESAEQDLRNLAVPDTLNPGR